jgi:hypothetical protein
MRYGPSAHRWLKSLVVSLSVAAGNIGFISALYGVSDEFKSIYTSFYIYFALWVLVVSIGAFLVLFFRLYPTEPPPPIPHDTVCELRMRYAIERDAKAIHNIALDAFGNKNLLFRVSELKRLIARKTFRVVEVKHVNSRDFVVAGYYAVMPLQITMFKLLQKGAFDESKISADYICDPRESRCEALYVLDLVQERGYSVARILQKDLIRLLNKLCLENSHITTIGTWAFNDKGIRMAEMYGMHRISEYEGEFKDTYFYELPAGARWKSSRLDGWLKKGFEDVHSIEL